MSKKHRHHTRKTKKTTTEKGRLVEKIVALLHEAQNVTIERNVHLPTRGNPRRRREIDVLVSTLVTGYPVRLAIECKNEKSKIGSPKIDAFIGKLQDIGIPTSYGIYVSASGYTQGAIERANEAGIRPLELIGLSQDQLEVAVRNAFESIIYLSLAVDTFSVFNCPRNREEGLAYYDQQGHICSTVPHLLWHMWLNDQIPTTLGEHRFLPLETPQGWFRMVDGELSGNDKVEAMVAAIVKVRACVLSIQGTMTNYSLKNATTEEIERKRVDFSFPTGKQKYPLIVFDNESELAAYLQSRKGLTLTIGRIKIPRIICGAAYWPPSERATRKLVEYEQHHKEATFTDIEGLDLSTAWEEPGWIGVPYNSNKKEN